MLVAGLALNYLVDVERYRPAIVAALHDATGMPVSMGKIRIRILPALGATISDVLIGEDDHRLIIRRVTATLRLSSLTERRIAISSVKLSGVSLSIPKNLSNLGALAERPSKPDAGPASAPSIDIDALHLRSGEIHEGADGPLLATFDVDAKTLLSENVPVHIAAKLPVWGKEAQCTIEGSVAPKKTPIVQAHLAFSQVSLSLLTGRPFGDAVAGIDADAKMTNPADAALVLTGSVSGAPHEAMNGTLSASAQWQSGVLTLNRAQWISPGAVLETDLVWHPPHNVECRIVNAHVGRSVLSELAGSWQVPEFRLNANDTAALDAQSLTVRVNDAGETSVPEGSLSLQGIDMLAPNGRPLLENLRIRAGVEDGVVRLNELAAEGLQLTGTLRPNWPARAIGVEGAGVIRLNPAWLTLAPPSFPLVDIDGECKVDSVAATVVIGGPFPQDFTASGSVNQVNAKINLPGHPLPLEIEDLKGGIAFKDGKFTLDDLAANGLEVSGSLTPLKRAASVDLRGKVSLDQAPLGFLVSPGLFRDWGGTLTVDAFKATFAGRGIPADFKLAAAIEKGRATLTLPGYVDLLSDVNARVHADTDGLKADLAFSSAQARDIQAHASYAAKSGEIQGTLTADLAQCALPFLKSIPDREVWFPIIGRTGLSTFRLDAKLPQGSTGDMPVTIMRQGEPAFKATLTLNRNGEQWKPTKVETSLTLPLQMLGSLVPKAIEAEGNAVLSAQGSFDGPRWTLSADFADTEAIVGDYLYKRRGDALSAYATCTFKPNGVDLSALHVRYGSLDIPLRLQDGGVFAENLDLDIAPLAGLLPKSGSVHGRVRGSFGTKPFKADLDLDGVSAFVAPHLGFDSVSGRVSVDGKRVMLDSVHAQGLDSDCTFTAEMIDGVFHGNAKGPRLNLNEVINFVDRLKEYRWNPKIKDPNEPWKPSPFECDLQTALDTLVYRKGSAQNVTGVFSMHEEVIRAIDLAATPYTGSLKGSLVVWPGQDKGLGKVEFEFDIRDADAKFVDETVFDVQRGLLGSVTGKVNMSIGTDGPRDAIEKTNGEFLFDAKHGSLGTIEFATGLREMLKTATLVRLRAPEYGKNDLSFDQCHAAVTMKNGVWTISDANMKNPYIAMTGAGVIDFPQQQSDVHLRVNYLESVTGIIEQVPVVGARLSRFGNFMGLNLLLYDSPYDMKVRLDPAQRFKVPAEKAGEPKENASKPASRAGR